MILLSGNEYVQINVAGRIYTNSNDYWDGNWLKSEIKINSYGFKGVYGTNLRADDFQRFYEALEKLSNNLTNEVEFTTMEDGLYLKGQLDVSGNIKWKGIAKSEPGANSLTFVIETDNTFIVQLVRDVKEILNRHPVVGNIG